MPEYSYAIHANQVCVNMTDTLHADILLGRKEKKAVVYLRFIFTRDFETRYARCVYHLHQ